MSDRPLTRPMRDYLVDLLLGRELRKWTVRWDSMRRSLVKRGLIEKRGAHARHALTSQGDAVARALTIDCMRCGGCGWLHAYTESAPAVDCPKCKGAGRVAA